MTRRRRASRTSSVSRLPGPVPPPVGPAGSAGRHRRPVPDSLPAEAPALVVAVAGHLGTPDVAAEVTSIVRVDNPSVDVRLARVRASQDDPSGLSAVLKSAAGNRPADQPAAIVVPLLALPYPAVTDAIRYDITQSGVNALIAEPFNVSLSFAEALHIRLADARLARADRAADASASRPRPTASSWPPRVAATPPRPPPRPPCCWPPGWRCQCRGRAGRQPEHRSGRGPAAAHGRIPDRDRALHHRPGGPARLTWRRPAPPSARIPRLRWARTTAWPGC